MSTSAIERRKERHAQKTAFVYLVVSIVCALMGAVYEIFSHEVYSYYMLYAFAFPLVGGALPFSMMAVFGVKKYPRLMARRLYHSGIAAWTVGSFVQGILNIYGTTNQLTVVYWIVGTVFVSAGILSWLSFRAIPKRK